MCVGTTKAHKLLPLALRITWLHLLCSILCPTILQTKAFIPSRLSSLSSTQHSHFHLSYPSSIFMQITNEKPPFLLLTRYSSNSTPPWVVISNIFTHILKMCTVSEFKHVSYKMPEAQWAINFLPLISL